MSKDDHYNSGAGSRADVRLGMRGVGRDFGEGTKASYCNPPMPAGVISAQHLLRRMPFEINIQSPASKELVSTKGKNTELSSHGSLMKTVSDLDKEDMKRRNPNCSTDEVVWNFGDQLFSYCVIVFI